MCLCIVWLDCLFKIIPQQRYAAQEQLKKATQNIKSVPDVVIKTQLQTAAKQEKEQSRIETDKQQGKPVKYGTSIVQVSGYVLWMFGHVTIDAWSCDYRCLVMFMTIDAWSCT